MTTIPHGAPCYTAVSIPLMLHIAHADMNPQDKTAIKQLHRGKHHAV